MYEQNDTLPVQFHTHYKKRERERETGEGDDQETLVARVASFEQDRRLRKFRTRGARFPPSMAYEECFELAYLRCPSHRLMTMVLRAGGPRRKVGTVQFSRSVNRPLSRNTCSARTRTTLPPRAPLVPASSLLARPSYPIRRPPISLSVSLSPPLRPLSLSLAHGT